MRGGAGVREVSREEVIFKFIFKINFMGVWLAYNIVLISAVSKVNQLYVYIYLLFLRFFSHIDHYRVLSGVPGATW